MPDDKNDDKIAEQDQLVDEEVDDALAAFMEDDEFFSGDKKEKADKPGKDKKTSKKDKEQDPDKDDKQPTYSDDLDKRIKDIGDDIDDSPPEKPEKPDKPPEKPDKSEKPGKPEKSEEFDIELSDDDLSDDLKEYKSDYPDDYEAITKIATIIAKKMIEKQGTIFDKDEFAKPEDVQEVNAKISDFMFWNEITDVHSDARQINKSKDFIDWLEKQDAPIQRIAKNMETPEDGIMILDYYKARKGKSKVDDIDKKARDKKKKTDDLHKGTIRNKPKVKSGGGPDMDDAEAAFNEDD